MSGTRSYCTHCGAAIRLTREQFTRGYRTTHDSSAMLIGLSSSKTALTATVTFTSHQAPSASPNHASCTTWRIVLYLRRVGGEYPDRAAPARLPRHLSRLRLSTTGPGGHVFIWSDRPATT